MSDDFLTEMMSMIRQVHTAPPIGTKDNPYVVVVPEWFKRRCEAEGTSPQEVYDAVFVGSSFQNGRVEIVEEYR